MSDQIDKRIFDPIPRPSQVVVMAITSIAHEWKYGGMTDGQFHDKILEIVQKFHEYLQQQVEYYQRCAIEEAMLKPHPSVIILDPNEHKK